MIDLHCHILLRVPPDDGPASVEGVLDMARVALGDGISTIVATPHLSFEDLAHPESIPARVEQVQEVVATAGLAVQILPGAEIPAVWEALEHAQALPFLGEQRRYVLLEVPLAGLPDYLPQLVFSLQVKGLQPVLAHPERTQLAHRNPNLLLELAERGCPLQLNADSVAGRWGRPARTTALRFLREVEHCVLATDAHDARQRPPLLSVARRAFRGLGGEKRFQQVTEEYPRKILSGENL